MRGKRLHLTGYSSPLFGSRRQFLGYSGAIVGASILAPLYPSRTSAQTATFNYFISPTGSNSNPGTLASPWALSALQSKGSTYAGKKVGIIGDQGTYEVLTLCGPYQSGGGSLQYTPLISLTGGTASNPTYIASCNSSGVYQTGFKTSGLPSSGWAGATLDGQGTSSNNASAQPVIGTYGSGGAYVTIDGLQIINAYYQAINVGYSSGAGQSGQIAGQIVQNCYINTITDNTSSENSAFIQLEGTTGALVQNNYLTGLTSNDGRGTCIICWTTSNATIQYNTIIATNASLNCGIDFKASCPGNNTVRYNYVDLSAAANNGGGANNGIVNFDDSGGAGSTDRCYGNILIGSCVAYPYSIITGGYPAAPNAQKWFNNTFVMVPTTNDQTGFTRYGGTGTIAYYNNIFAHASGTGFGSADFLTNQTALGLCDYNCWAASAPKWGLAANGTQFTVADGPYTTFATWKSGLAAKNAACIGLDAHSIQTNPMFAGSGAQAALYKLATGSPCTGTGSTNGQASGSTCDMGAWGNGATQIGCSFAPSASTATTVTPDAPYLSVT